MAKGDKIFLADKATLDLVNTTLDLVKATVEAINTQARDITSSLTSMSSTIRSDISSLSSKSDDILSIVGSSDSYDMDDIRQSRQGLSNIPTNSSYVTVTSLTGPGELHYMVAQSPTATSTVNNIYMQVIVDGVTIYNSTAYTAANTAGTNIALFSKDSSMGLDAQSLTRLVGGYTLTSRTIGALSNDSVNRHQTIQTEHIMSLKPIRWNSSLEVRAYSTAINSILYYYYKLD